MVSKRRVVYLDYCDGRLFSQEDFYAMQKIPMQCCSLFLSVSPAMVSNRGARKYARKQHKRMYRCRLDCIGDERADDCGTDDPGIENFIERKEKT